MTNENKQYNFYPRKPMRSFRDLEVYVKTLECAITVVSSIRKSIPEFPELQGMVNCSLSIPLWIAEAHSMRFSDKKRSTLLLEQSMAGCNKMVVYLEEALGLYGKINIGLGGGEINKKQINKKKISRVQKKYIDFDVVDELIKKYLAARGKIFRLEKSWEKWNSRS